MSAIQSISSSAHLISTQSQPAKPMSLTVHQVAVPILKTLAVFLGLVATAIFVLPLVFNSSFLPFCGIFAGILGGTAISIGIKAESIAKDILALKNPEWAAYYSKKLKNASIEQVLKEIPNVSIWPQLTWNGEEWKEKILPYARTHQLNRQSLRQKFESVFDEFDPHLRDYYREKDLPLLQREGYKAFMTKAQSFQSATKGELREKLLQETSGLTCKEIFHQIGSDPFYDGYLNFDEFISRFDLETEGFTLDAIYDQYPAHILARGLLTAERLASLLDSAIQTHPEWNYDDVESRWKALKNHPAWLQSPRLQKLLILKISDSHFRFSRSNLFEFEMEQISQLPKEWSALIEMLRAEQAKIMKKSQQHEDARALYLHEPAKILQQFEKGGRDSYEYWEWVDNPKYKTLEQDYQSWKRADLLYQERMLPEFDQKAREKIAGLLNTPSK